MMDVGDEALDLLTVGEVAKRLRLSVATINRLVYADLKEPGTGIESVKVRRSRRVAPEAVAEYKKRLRDAARGDAA